MILDIEDKEDSIEKLEAIQGKPTKFYLFAIEFRKLVNYVRNYMPFKTSKLENDGDGTSPFITKNELTSELTSAVIGASDLNLPEQITISDNDFETFVDVLNNNKGSKITAINKWNNYYFPKISTVLDAFFEDFQTKIYNLQIGLSNKIPFTQKGTANGVATLDANVKVPASQLKFGTTLGTITEGNDERLVEAFKKKVNAISFTGDTNKTLTVTREDGTILTASFLDNNDPNLPDDVINTLSFNANNDGVLVAITSEGEIISVSLDGRYSLIGHSHTIGQIPGLSDSLASLEPKSTTTAGTIPKAKIGGGDENSSLSETDNDIISSKKIKGFKAFWLSIVESGFTGLFGGGEEGTGGTPNGIQAKWRTNFYGNLFDFSVYRNDSDLLHKAEMLFNNVMKFRFSNNGHFIAQGNIETGGVVITNPGTSNNHAVTLAQLNTKADESGVINKSNVNQVKIGTLRTGGLMYDSAVEISGSNANDLILGGWFKGAGIVGAPNAGWFYIFVEVHTADWVVQTWKSLGAGNVGGQIFNRSKIAADWFLYDRYIMSSGDITINGLKTFSNSPVIPNGTEDFHPATMQQLYETVATESFGINTEWEDIPNTLPSSFNDVVLRYKIKNSIYILDFSCSCDGSNVVGSVTDLAIATLPRVDSEKLKTIILDSVFSKDNGDGISKMMLVSNGEADSEVRLHFTFRDSIPFEEVCRATLPITDFENY